MIYDQRHGESNNHQAQSAAGLEGNLNDVTNDPLTFPDPAPGWDNFRYQADHRLIPFAVAGLIRLGESVRHDVHCPTDSIFEVSSPDGETTWITSDRQAKALETPQ